MAPIYGLVDDLASLSDLDEQIILKELKERYDRDIIYTYIGDILVAVNPYKQIQGYGDQIGHEYKAIRELSEKPPHVYAMATQCYQNVRRTDVNQCLLVSGESGAGKTETSKMLVAQVVRISNTSGLHDLHEKIIEVNPLLEAFGNAQTVMNNNSSRFGKLIEIMLSQTGEITGAKITEHMLEKTRVVRKSQGERSFHIFYYMLAGMSGHEKRRFYLDRPPEYYRIVDQGYGNPVFVNGSDFQANESMLHDLNRIMEDVGFDRQEVDRIYGLMAGILHLCNIEFAEDPEMGHVIIMNEEAIDYAAALLSLQAEDLATVLLSNRSFVRGERIVAMKTVLQAVDGRDALAKTLYSRLFSWIVQQINTILDPPAYRGDDRQSVISILDMAGFENFAVNSLEQLCINTANEQLQNFFNEYIFTMELKEYQGEGIKPPKIKFTNNRDILDMLLRRPNGVYAILEDECRLQTTTDLSFVEKLNHAFSKHEFYKKCKSRDPVFTIYHYAGHVTYRTEGFLDKNRDTMSPNLYSLMENSSSPLIAQLFGAMSQLADPYRNPSGRERNHWDAPDWSIPTRPGYGPGDSLSRQVGRKIKQRLVQDEMRQPRGGAPVQSSSGHFRNSLGELVEKLNSSEPHFIRCLKPNASQKPMNFDPKLVINQLLSTGVLETTKIRKLGYPTRLPFHVFVDRYKFVAFSITQRVEPDYYACLHILQAAGITDCEIGKSKVFLRYWQVDRLNVCLDEILKDLVIVQNVIRMYLCRRHFLRKRHEHYRHQDMIASFGDFVAHEGDKAYHMMISSRDHDERNYRSELEKQRRAREQMFHRYQPSRHRGLRRYVDDDIEMRSRLSSHNRPQMYNSPRPDYSPQQRAGAGYYNSDSNIGRYSTGYIMQNVLNQVMQKLFDIDHDIWCKVHYMEYDRTVAKFYILDREVVIDGSYEEFDGERIGLGVFRNPARDDRTEHIRQYIGKGLKLRKDEDGSIFATRLGSHDVIVKDHTHPRDNCFSEDVITHNGLLPFNEGIKVFDMEEFKSHMGLQMKFKQYNEQILEQLSMVGISFIEDNEEFHETPCWLLVVNLIALRNISDANIKNQVQQKIAELSIRDQEKVEEDLRKKFAGQRHSDRRWSKVNPRQGVQGKEAPLRKTRLELRSKGEKINKHMIYSWDEENYRNKKKQLNLAELQEEYEDPESMMGGPRSPSSVMQRHYSNGRDFHFNDRPVRQNWAKLKVYIKEEERENEERDLKAKQENFS